MDSVARSAFLEREPKAEPFIHPYVGSQEHINGGERWILCLDSVTPQTLKTLPKVLDIIEQVRRWRLGELPPRKLQADADAEDNKASSLSLALAKTPTAFHVTVIPDRPFLAIPEVSSERRAYLPIAWLTPPTIPSNKLLIAPNVDLHQFELISSRMHMAWVWNIGGRLKSDPQYSPGISYNPFPWPKLSAVAKVQIAKLAENILAVRAAHSGSSLADLYDRRTMPKDLLRAHEKLDMAVDRIFRSTAFTSDRERVEYLLGLYDKAMAPLAATTRSTKPRRGRAAGAGR